MRELAIGIERALGVSKGLPVECLCCRLHSPLSSSSLSAAPPVLRRRTKPWFLFIVVFFARCTVVHFHRFLSLFPLRKMNSIQVTACQPTIYVTNISRCYHPSKAYAFPINTGPLSRISLSLRGKPSSGLQCVPFSKSRQPLHVCFAGDKGMMGNNGEDSPWKALEKAMEKFKGESVEDVLRQQIQKGQYLDDGGSGAKPPGGGGGGGGEGPSGSDEESFSGTLDETLQAVLATLGFIFMYIYILKGQELARLARDYIRYLFTGKQSVRLKRAMSEWGEYYLTITEKEVVDKYCLEKAILNTPTWWNDPEDYREVLINYLRVKIR